MYTLSALTGGIATRFTGGSEGMSRAGRAIANVSHEGGETLSSRLGRLTSEIGEMAKDFSAGWKGRPRGIWPTYEADLMTKAGDKIARAEGAYYDAHHIIENVYGGPAEWWNIHPARFPDQHQGGIHRAGGVLREIFK